MIKHISILGSGNVAYHIARKLRAEDFVIDCVFSRNHITGQSLADEVNAVFTDDLFQISSKSDAYLFMMSDEANASIAAQISLPDEKICIHTSGSLPKEIFKQKNAAVMYPFQTFSRDVKIDNFSEIPVCIETSNADTFHEVRCLAEKISPLIYELSFEQRKVLHVAGYSLFLNMHQGRILYLELGVGFNTPGIIKFSFWRMSERNPKAKYVCLNYDQACTIPEIEDRSICINADAGAVLDELLISL